MKFILKYKLKNKPQVEEIFLEWKDAKERSVEVLKEAKEKNELWESLPFIKTIEDESELK